MDSPPRRSGSRLRLGPAFRDFIALEASGGLLLFAATLLALFWANSPWSDSYHGLWRMPISLGVSKPLLLWVNDGLMAFFFLMVGLEIKREMVGGELADPRLAALPLAAAAGGMLLPATLYAVANFGGSGAAGWGIPVATDIAFALGVVTLLGSRVPSGLKVLLTALAIFDDLGAVLIIAFFYTATLSWPSLVAAVLVITALLLLNRLGVRRAWPYAVLGAGLWFLVLKSGIHATIAGVLLALSIPSDRGGKEERSLLERMEHALHPWVTYGVLPIFALANAGVSLSGDLAGTMSHPVSVGILAGLCLGKPLGIAGGSWLAVRLRVAVLPLGITWRQMIGIGFLGGVGFTMSLFVAGLAFQDASIHSVAKLSILAASGITGIVGACILFQRPPRRL